MTVATIRSRTTSIRFIMTSSSKFGIRNAECGINKNQESVLVPSAVRIQHFLSLVDLYVPCTLVLHGVNALYGLLDLAYLGELLAHLEIDLKGLGKFLGSIVGLRKTYEQDGVVRFDLVLIALVASGLQVRDGFCMIGSAEIVLADSDVRFG